MARVTVQRRVAGRRLGARRDVAARWRRRAGAARCDDLALPSTGGHGLARPWCDGPALPSTGGHDAGGRQRPRRGGRATALGGHNGVLLFATAAVGSHVAAGEGGRVTGAATSRMKPEPTADASTARCLRVAAWLRAADASAAMMRAKDRWMSVPPFFVHREWLPLGSVSAGVKTAVVAGATRPN